MKSGKPILSWIFVLLLFCCSMNAQQTSSPTGSTTVPHLVNFSGKATDTQGKAIFGIAGATFAIYKDQYEAAPLWLETQNVTADTKGNYTAQLGATKPDGLPLDLFSSGEGRWLGVTVNGGQEQPRVLLLSVPYALKAADAETIGGLPPSAFVLANKRQVSGTSPKSAWASTPAAAKNAAPPANPAVTGKGTLEFIPMWDSASDIVNSTIFQKSSQIGIGTTAPAATLDVNGKSDVRDTLTLFPKGTDPTLAINGTTFKVDQMGKVTFASGQTFPGAGTVTSVGLSAPTTDFTVTGSPVTKSGTLKFAWTVPPTTTNTPNSIVKRDASGGISAGIVNATFVSSVSTSSNSYGIFGVDDGPGSAGVWGSSASGKAGVYGFLGNGDPTYSYGVAGENDSSSGGKGVFGWNPNGYEGFGVQGYATGPDGFGVVGTTNPFGLVASSLRGTASIGVLGDSQSGYAVVAASDQGNALIAETDGSNDTTYIQNNGGGYPLYAVSTKGGGGSMGLDPSGNLIVSGAVFAGTKDFRIDHPLDPANKYLYHASVESSEMMNIYTGNITTDSQGVATVRLPEWFETVNTDFRYQLTVIGQFAQAIVSSKIENNEFSIRTSAPSVEVSWQVTGVRHDAYAKAHPLQVSVDKADDERGYYIHPELYGAAADKGLASAHRTRVIERARQAQAKPTQTIKP